MQDQASGEQSRRGGGRERGSGYSYWGDYGPGGEYLTVVKNLMAGSQILPSQQPSPSDWSPHKQLAAAVLASAMMDIRDRRADGKDTRRVREALQWVNSDDAAWPYSFLRLCEVFALTPAWVRRVVRRWATQPAAAPERRAQLSDAA